MTHLSENSRPLQVKQIPIQSSDDLDEIVQDFNDVCMVVLPLHPEADGHKIPLRSVGAFVANVANKLGPATTLITVGEVTDLVQVQAAIPQTVRYQHWIAIKRQAPRIIDSCSLPNYHFGALIHTRYKKSLRHVKTRIEYTYCPVCDRTTKDYGGKKHTYHEYGTLISDVWRDIACGFEEDISPIITRFQDLFGIDSYKELLVLDCRLMDYIQPPVNYTVKPDWVNNFNIGRERALPYSVSQHDLFGNATSSVELPNNDLPANLTDQILNGDCLEWLKEIPSNTIDFIFTDPPYNLGKKYSGYTDDLEIQKYFSWCDQWIAELARILKPGRTFAILNIPLWATRHFLFMETVLQFQNWIAWDALAFPVRLIMPAHYAILAFSKGVSRQLPGLIGEAGQTNVPNSPLVFKSLEPLAEGYCLRSSCVKHRQIAQIDDRGPLTDLWWDIHRLKHNSRRVDHPTQLPPHLMYRLISIFSKPGEIVLDCFNGAGTTTLAAHQLGRHYIGIEKSQKYCDIAKERHREIDQGLDPFRKAERTLIAKNSPVPRMPKQKYEIPKKTLQLEVKRIAQKLGRLPTRDEVSKYGKYPLRYYDEYFIGWGEVCAAARTTGMTEVRTLQDNDDESSSINVTQLSLGLDEEELD